MVSLPIKLFIEGSSLVVLPCLPLAQESIHLCTGSHCMACRLHSLFTHPPTKRHLCCFQVLPITDKAEINIHVLVFVQTYVFKAKMTIAKSYSKSVFNFIRNRRSGFPNGHSTGIPASHEWEGSCPSVSSVPFHKGSALDSRHSSK